MGSVLELPARRSHPRFDRVHFRLRLWLERWRGALSSEAFHRRADARDIRRVVELIPASEEHYRAEVLRILRDRVPSQREAQR